MFETLISDYPMRDRFCKAVYDATEQGNRCFSAIERALDRMESGMSHLIEEKSKPHRVVSYALNCCSAILCAPLEMMKDYLPTEADEPCLAPLRTMLARGKALGQRVCRMCGIDNTKSLFRHFKFKFKGLLLTPLEIAKRQYTAERFERIIDAGCKCARSFLTWLRTMLIRLENTYVFDEHSPISPGFHAKAFVLQCDRRYGAITLVQSDGQVVQMVLSPTANAAWRIVRQLVGAMTRDGAVQLPEGALACFRTTDAKNDLRRDGLWNFARYIHSTGKKNVYRLANFPKKGYAK